MVRNHLCHHYTTGLQNKNRMQWNIPTASMAEKVLLTHTLLCFTKCFIYVLIEIKMFAENNYPMGVFLYATIIIPYTFDVIR